MASQQQNVKEPRPVPGRTADPGTEAGLTGWSPKSEEEANAYTVAAVIAGTNPRSSGAGRTDHQTSRQRPTGATEGA